MVLANPTHTALVTEGTPGKLTLPGSCMVLKMVFEHMLKHLDLNYPSEQKTS
jgi:hypothetical protein